MSDKLHNLLRLLDSALTRLEDVLGKPKDEYMRDSAIQRFEFTFELFWKALKAHAEISGLRAPSPRDALRTAFDLACSTTTLAGSACSRIATSRATPTESRPPRRSARGCPRTWS